MVANLAIVEVGATGQITIANTSAGSVQITVDALAYYDMSGISDAPGSYLGLWYQRGSSTPGLPQVPLPAAKACRSAWAAPPVFRPNAAAVVVNLTVTQPTSFGFITAYPTGTQKPNVSNQNYTKGQTIPSFAVVPVGSNGTVTIANTSSGKAHVIADVVGYFLPGTPTSSGAFAGIAPQRFLDTRTFRGPVGSAYTVPVQVAGVNGIPNNATGVWVNLTVTEPTAFGYVMARGYEAPWQDASNLNFDRRQNEYLHGLRTHRRRRQDRDPAHPPTGTACRIHTPDRRRLRLHTPLTL